MSNNGKSGDGFATGVIMILIGIFALCATFFHFHIVWSQLLRLWPLLLIIIGVSVIPINRWIRTGIIILVLICGAIGYHYLVKNYDGKGIFNMEIIDNDEDNDWDYYDESIDIQEDTLENQDDNTENQIANDDSVQEFSEPYKKSISHAEVEVNYGAGELKIGSPTSNLIYASNSSRFIRQGFNVRYDGSNEAEIKFTSEGKTNNLKKQDNKFVMSLNTNPVWDIDFNIGACDVNLDFSQYKIAEIDFEAGACNVDMKIGTLYDNTKIDVETGASNITIRIPETAGCKIECESALSTKAFEGFRKVNGGVYETDNYGSVQQNIVIDLSCAVSNVNIKRY